MSAPFYSLKLIWNVTVLATVVTLNTVRLEPICQAQCFPLSVPLWCHCTMPSAFRWSRRRVSTHGAFLLFNWYYDFVVPCNIFFLKLFIAGITVLYYVSCKRELMKIAIFICSSILEHQLTSMNIPDSSFATSSLSSPPHCRFRTWQGVEYTNFIHHLWTCVSDLQFVRHRFSDSHFWMALIGLSPSTIIIIANVHSFLFNSADSSDSDWKNSLRRRIAVNLNDHKWNSSALLPLILKTEWLYLTSTDMINHVHFFNPKIKIHPTLRGLNSQCLLRTYRYTFRHGQLLLPALPCIDLSNHDIWSTVKCVHHSAWVHPVIKVREHC